MEKHFQVIDDNAVLAAQNFLRSEAELVRRIQAVEAARVFEKLGFASLFSYCEERLKLSKSYTYAFIGVARKSASIPELQKAVDTGELTVSQAKRILPVIEPGNADSWIEKASTQTQRDIEQEVARHLPEPPPSARVRKLGGEMSEVKVTVSDTLRKKLERLMAVRGCSLPEALDFALEETLKRHDPIRKAERAATKAKKPGIPLEGKSATPPAAIKHAVNLRDNGQCTFVRPDGVRCTNEWHLELHHIQPRGLGGEHSVSNLTTLCGAHHRALHQQQPY